MWHNNVTVNRTYTTHHGQNCWAIINTIAGWKKVKTGSADGVTNVHVALCAAKANNRSIDIYLNGNEVERVTLK